MKLFEKLKVRNFLMRFKDHLDYIVETRGSIEFTRKGRTFIVKLKNKGGEKNV